jgi:long-chain acyl-CoA synthetase
VRVVVGRADGDPAAAPQEVTVAPGVLDAHASVVPVAVDGWLDTADVGALDDDGVLRVLWRRDDVIVSGGENVSPTEVEAVLGTVAGVADVAVAGVPDPEWGHVVAAWVVPAAGGPPPTLDGLRATARARLAPHKLPRRLYVVDTLPRTASGKLRRHVLRGYEPAPAGDPGTPAPD